MSARWRCWPWWPSGSSPRRRCSAAIDPAPRSDWTTLERPYRAFSLTAPNLPEADYAIRRHAAGGRKDVMTVGAAEDAGSRS